MKLNALSFVFLCLFGIMNTKVNAQAKNPYPNNDSLLKVHLLKTRYDIDTNAKAVILYNKGEMIVNNNGNFYYQYEQTAKILSENAVENFAEIVIQKPEGTNITNITAYSYNLNGSSTVTQKIDNSNIKKEQYSKGVNLIKVNVPNVKKGTIIHYTYTMDGMSNFRLPDWYFQRSYPILYSEFGYKFPIYFILFPLERSSITFREVNNTNDLYNNNYDACKYSITSANSNSSFWIRRNIPAFTAEPYTLSDENYREKIRIHINAADFNGYFKRIATDWKSVNEDILYKNKEIYGSVYARNNFLKSTVDSICKPLNTPLDKAKALHTYIQSVMNPYNGSYKIDVKDIFEKKQATELGSNMLLTAMLIKAGIKAELVLLSTRDQEMLNAVYPRIDLLNYAITKATIDNKTYLLDAYKKNNPFGIINSECYNGYARIVSEFGSEMNLSADSILNRNTTLINIKPTNDVNTFSVELKQKLGTYSSIAFRDKWKNNLTMWEQQKQNTNNINFIKLTKIDALNLNHLDSNITIIANYEFTIDNNTSTVYFSPFIEKLLENNPFTQSERKLPINFDYKQDNHYVLNMQLNDAFEVEEHLKSNSFALNNNETMLYKNLYKFNEKNNSISISNRLQINTTSFEPEYYTHLKTIFDKIIEQQNQQLVLKRK